MHLNQLTDFHETLYEHQGIQGHSTFIQFNFLLSKYWCDRNANLWGERQH